MTYSDRTALAKETAEIEEITSLMLVDEMTNPVWCTYGPAPNAAFLIGTGGRVVTSQTWYDPGAMERSIRSYITSH